MLPGFKRCSECRLPKPIGEFTHLLDSSDGYRPRCKRCEHAYRKAYTAAHPKTIAAAKKRYLQRHPDRNRQQQKDWRARHPEGDLLNKARSRARRGGFPCTITRADIVIPKVCPILGIPLRAHYGEGKRGFDDSPTLDRLVPLLGYVPGNVTVISGRANRIKNDATLQELERIVNWFKRQPGVPDV